MHMPNRAIPPSMTSLARLADSLTSSTGDHRRDEASALRARLAEMHDAGAIAAALSDVSADYYRLEIARQSRETPTHRKWFVYASDRGASIWLHEFKDADAVQSAGSFAASIHNHRYAFVSVLLTGGYSSSSYEVVPEAGIVGAGERVSTCDEVGVLSVLPGRPYYMDVDTFHRLHSVAPHTSSLVVQFPPDYSVSFSVDESQMLLREHPDLENHRDLFERAFSRTVSNLH